MMSLFREKEFFTPTEKEKIVAAIKEAETRTSGEVRVYVESRCRFVDPMDRAAELFWSLKMDLTKDRNGVLVYVALKDRQLAVLGDEGIHKKVGDEFWNKQVKAMLNRFRNQDYSDGLIMLIADIGNALQEHFPYDRQVDKNELPDDLVFGK
jgi:uncharacterized membrane protein